MRLLLAVLCILPSVAFAQLQNPLVPMGSGLGKVTGASIRANMPQPSTSAPQSRPAITPCSAQTAVGIWKMQALYETPAGRETESFKQTPERYMELAASSHYFGVSGTEKLTTYTALRAAAAKAVGKSIWQYSISPQGVLSLFNNGAVAASFHCGIASETKGGYNAGDMILTPTQRGASQVFRHYRRITL